MHEANGFKKLDDYLARHEYPVKHTASIEREPLPEPLNAGTTEHKIWKAMEGIDDLVREIRDTKAADPDLVYLIQAAGCDLRYAYALVHRNVHGDYQAYLKSAQWEQIQVAIKSRDNSTCKKCGDRWREGRPEFHVHHLTYERRGQELLSDLQLLCPDCHAKEHGLVSAFA